MTKTLTIAVSARALFNMEHSNEIFVNEGIEAFIKHQVDKEDKPLKKGSAFPLIKKLLSLNEFDNDKPTFEVIVISSIHSEASLRVIKSIDHYGLNIGKSAFTGSADVIPYLSAFNVDLLLSRSITDTQNAVDAGIPAAMLYAMPEDNEMNIEAEQIRIAFDGDAVLFSDESEKVYKTKGLEAFLEHERKNVEAPLPEGPLAKFMHIIQRIQDASNSDVKPFRTSLVTARGGDARERVLKTLRSWNVKIDEMYFLSGMNKSPILEAFNPHIFFDDQDTHLKHSSKIVPSAKVPYLSSSEMNFITN